jgi:hypothetical protein
LSGSSRGYLRLRPWILENVPLLSGAAIEEFIPLESISTEALTDSQIDRLLAHDLLGSWILGPEEMRPLAKEISEAEESRILVSEVQKRERIEEVKEKGVTALFSDTKRSLIKRRLEEMAYVFFRLDQEPYALLSLSVARTLEKENSLLGVNPFLKAMVERSLTYYLKSFEGAGDSQRIIEDSPPSIILP